MERQGATKEEQVLASDVKIVADKSTNTLVVTARPDDFDTIERTARDLDVERKQVFIEALIMEASSSASFSFGVNWAAGKGRDDVFLYGSSNLGGDGISFPSSSSGGTLGFPSGGSLGAIIEDAVTIGGTAYSIQAVLSAVQGDSNYRILATPQLLTLDNEEARVDVVDNVPFTKDASTSNVNQDYNSVSIDYKDVGIKLKITPHISANDTLRLEVLQEVSRVTSTAVQGTNIIAPTTRKREVETTIRMLDGQTAVIAGLLSEDGSNSNAKVPGAGDIPLLGWLFKNKEESNSKTNLLIFITPRVINSLYRKHQTGQRAQAHAAQRPGEPRGARPARGGRARATQAPADGGPMSFRSLEGILLSRGHLTREDAERLAAEAGKAGRTMEQAILASGLVAEEDMTEALGETYGLDVLAAPAEGMVDGDMVRRFSIGYLKKHGVVPLKADDGSLLLAMSAPSGLALLPDMAFALGGAQPVPRAHARRTRARSREPRVRRAPGRRRGFRRAGNGRAGTARRPGRRQPRRPAGRHTAMPRSSSS